MIFRSLKVCNLSSHFCPRSPDVGYHPKFAINPLDFQHQFLTLLKPINITSTIHLYHLCEQYIQILSRTNLPFTLSHQLFLLLEPNNATPDTSSLYKSTTCRCKRSLFSSTHPISSLTSDVNWHKKTCHWLTQFASVLNLAAFPILISILYTT